MTVFYVTSIDPAGATITTRHFLPTAAETEKLKRAMAGHTGIAVQLGAPDAVNPASCTKRSIKPLPHTGGRHHA